MARQILDVTPGAGDSGTAGGGKINANFAELYAAEVMSRAPKTTHTWQTNGVELTAPTPGNSVTLLTKAPGTSGIVWAMYLVASYGGLWKDGRIQIFVDGEVLPSVDYDLGTVFGTAFDGTSTSTVLANDYIHTAPVAGASNEWSGEIRFPIPYSNGIIIKLFSPAAMSTVGGFGTYFYQIAGEDTLPAAWSSYRLRSVGVPAASAVSYIATDQITWIDKPNCAGSVVLLAQAAQGIVPTGGQQNYGFLERQQWFAIDGEAATPDGSGAINTSYASSGGEDWYHTGWYFAAINRFAAPDVIVTAANNANRSACASLNFLKRHGGIRFESSIKGGWSRKDGATGNTLMNGHSDAYTILYYLDTSVAFVPTVPLTPVGTSVSATSANWTWTRPKSDGSNFLTGYTITLSPGGATQTVTADINTATFTGLTTSTTYTASIVATNAAGNSTAATATATPAAATVPGAPTIGTATPGNTTASIAFTPPASTGGSPITGYTATSTPGSFTGTAASSPIIVTGLANGTAYTFTVHATNAVGNSAESAASGSVTPAAATVIGEDTFVRANANVVGSTVPLGTPGGQTWVQGNGSFSPLIVSNIAKVNASEANSTTESAVFPTGLNDVTVYASGTVPSGSAYNWGPVARWTSTTNNISVAASNGFAKLFVSGVQRGSSFAITPGTGSNTIKLDVRGTAINVYWNGGLAISYTLTGGENTAITGQSAGFAFFKGTSPNETGITQITDVKVTN